MDIEFQMKPGASGPDMTRVLQAVRALPGVRSAVQVMPAARAADLRLVCIAQVETAAADAVLDRLRANPAVDYAEIAPGRGLR